MRILGTIMLCVFFTHSVNAYWQQKVDHNIQVTLDDKNHILRAYQEMTYTNNSPDTLKYIFIHLYPNAYKHDHTAFVKQKVEDGDTDFYYSNKYDKGFIDSLEFRQDNELVDYSKYNDHDDIVFLELAKPLYPGQSTEITTPFRVVIPKNFSRLGHEGQSYQITQWYPKPAVYDKDGWHMMPYLDQGEFYYEYGDYEVEIKVPKEYVVPATGDFMSEEGGNDILDDLDILSGKAKSKSRSLEFKTSTFVAKNVHDFAWFADKNFKVLKEEFQLPSGRKCTAYAFYTEENKGKYKTSAKALAETAKYLSEEVGEYPYNQISIVDGPLYAGGGMEYPNIAIIGKLPSQATVNIVIAHEAGHNWFQGILGSNERVHPWLDEGVNSFYEAKVVERLKKKKIPVDESGSNAVVYMLNGHIHQDQPIELPSEDYLSSNYGGVVYAKAAQALAYLEAFMSPEDFSKGIKQYYKNWNIKHPSPADFREAMERNTQKNLDWFFDDLLTSPEPIDYKISSVKKEGDQVRIRLKDKFGASSYPVPVYGVRDSQIVFMNWVWNGETTFPNEEGVAYVVDYKNWIPEINKANNSHDPNKFLNGQIPKVGIGTSILKPGKNKVYLLPAFGFNNYDRTMYGLTLHNLTIPNKQFQFGLAPLYSSRSKRLSGTGTVGYSFYPKKNFYRVTASIQGATFSDDSTRRNLTKAIYPRWYKINPRLQFELKKPYLRSPISRSIVLNYFHTATQGFDFTQDPVDSIFRASVGSYEKNNLFRINYIHRNDRTFNPFGYNIQYETTRDIAKLSAEGNIKIDYFIPKKALYIRAFAGKFFYLNNETSFFEVAPYFLNVTPTAVNDYAYENAFLGRNERDGWMSQQVMDKEGGFSTRTTFLANPLGRTDDWLVSVNLRSDIPLKYRLLPQVFFNAASFGGAGQTNPSGSTTLFEGGLQFNLINNLIKVNVPLVLSKDFKNYTQSIYTSNRFSRQISFSLSTNRIDFLKTQEVITDLIF